MTQTRICSHEQYYITSYMLITFYYVQLSTNSNDISHNNMVTLAVEDNLLCPSD